MVTIDGGDRHPTREGKRVCADLRIVALSSAGLQNQDLKAFGLRISKLRKDKNMSIAQIAKLMQKSTKQIVSIESGICQLSIQDISVLMARFDVSFEWLCQDLIAGGQQKPCKSQKEVEFTIAAELSKLSPGVLDRIIRALGAVRVVGEACKSPLSASADVMKEIEILVLQSDLVGPQLLGLQEEPSPELPG